jgi:hypothetical protein
MWVRSYQYVQRVRGWLLDCFEERVLRFAGIGSSHQDRNSSFVSNRVMVREFKKGSYIIYTNNVVDMCTHIGVAVGGNSRLLKESVHLVEVMFGSCV